MSAHAEASDAVWELRLYVAGQTPQSLRAFANLSRICEEHLAGRYRIEVIDLIEQPALAAGHQIVAIPTLVRELPPPIRKIIGDLSDSERTLVGLDIHPTTPAPVLGSPQEPESSEGSAPERLRVAEHEPDRYVLRLYTFGASPSSVRAVANLRRLCDEHLSGRYDLEVVDLRQDPLLADDQIVAVPTLVKRLPPPVRQFVGDLSNEAVILVGLGLQLESASGHLGTKP